MIDFFGGLCYSKMNVYGVSVVVFLGWGIVNVEYVFYNSFEDIDGSDGKIVND